MIYLLRYASAATLLGMVVGIAWSEIVMPAFERTATTLATTARPLFPQQPDYARAK